MIHAGLYYGADSLKTKLCIRGRQLLYALCEKYHIPYRNTGKWIVAQNEAQLAELVKVHDFTRTLDDVPTHFVPLDVAAREEPDVRARAGILASPTTGIVDSHAYMQYLLGSFEDLGGDLALHSPVVSIRALGSSSSSSPLGSQGWEITTRDQNTGELTVFTSETLINSAGLGAATINNMILPPARHRELAYAKGNYFSYAPSTPRTSRLIYPAPEPGHAGLGTHLTLDLSGRIRFGPDVEWVSSPDLLSVSSAQLPAAITAIREYLPGIKEEAITPDYAGIRPKLGRGAVGQGKGFVDFWIRMEEGTQGFVNLLGVESPGLTSSLAIGEMVEGLLYR